MCPPGMFLALRAEAVAIEGVPEDVVDRSEQVVERHLATASRNPRSLAHEVVCWEITAQEDKEMPRAGIRGHLDAVAVRLAVSQPGLDDPSASNQMLKLVEDLSLEGGISLSHGRIGRLVRERFIAVGNP